MRARKLGAKSGTGALYSRDGLRFLGLEVVSFGAVFIETVRIALWLFDRLYIEKLSEEPTNNCDATMYLPCPSSTQKLGVHEP